MLLACWFSAVLLLPQGPLQPAGQSGIALLPPTANDPVASLALDLGEHVASADPCRIASPSPLHDDPAQHGNANLLDENQGAEWLPRPPPPCQRLAPEHRCLSQASCAFASADLLPDERPPSLSA